MKDYICQACGRTGHSEAPREYLKDARCPYCGAEPEKKEPVRCTEE